MRALKIGALVVPYLGAAVDSVAFGFSFPIAFGQFVAKVAGAYLWARTIQGVRTQREIPARDTQTELA